MPGGRGAPLGHREDEGVLHLVQLHAAEARQVERHGELHRPEVGEVVAGPAVPVHDLVEPAADPPFVEEVVHHDPAVRPQHVERGAEGFVEAGDVVRAVGEEHAVERAFAEGARQEPRVLAGGEAPQPRRAEHVRGDVVGDQQRRMARPGAGVELVGDPPQDRGEAGGHGPAPQPGDGALGQEPGQLALRQLERIAHRDPGAVHADQAGAARRSVSRGRRDQQHEHAFGDLQDAVEQQLQRRGLDAVARRELRVGDGQHEQPLLAHGARRLQDPHDVAVAAEHVQIEAAAVGVEAEELEEAFDPEGPRRLEVLHAGRVVLAAAGDVEVAGLERPPDLGEVAVLADGAEGRGPARRPARAAAPLLAELALIQAFHLVPGPERVEVRLEQRLELGRPVLGEVVLDERPDFRVRGLPGDDLVQAEGVLPQRGARPLAGHGQQPDRQTEVAQAARLGGEGGAGQLLRVEEMGCRNLHAYAIVDSLRRLGHGWPGHSSIEVLLRRAVHLEPQAVLHDELEDPGHQLGVEARRLAARDSVLQDLALPLGVAVRQVSLLLDAGRRFGPGTGGGRGPPAGPSPARRSSSSAHAGWSLLAPLPCLPANPRYGHPASGNRCCS